ncbi:MAG: type II CAAX endopeptidase family protein [Myxococcota bacterium]|nr:type II CAAX endopeptidase family protein [Myxococcota bacterium]
MSDSTTISRGMQNASILEHIFLGDLHSDSIIQEEDNLRQLPLKEHPDYSVLFNVARRASAMQHLGSKSLLAKRKAKWTQDLEKSPLATILYTLFREQATGFMVVEHDSHKRIVALSTGLPTVAWSNVADEQFGRFLLTERAVSPQDAALAHALCENTTHSIGWALLHMEAMSPLDLERAQREYARRRLLPAFAASEGKVHFYPDETAGDLSPVLDMSFMALIREGIWQNREPNLSVIEEITADLTSDETRLSCPHPLGTLEWELNNTERMVLRNLSAGQKLSTIIEQAKEPRQQAMIMKGCHLLVQMGALDVAESEAMARERHRVNSAQLDSQLNRDKYAEEAREILLGGNNPLAQRMFRRLYNKDNTNPETMAYLSLAMYRANPRRNAQRSYQMVFEAITTSNSAIPHATLSLLLDDMGSTKQASDHRTKALSLGQAQNKQKDVLDLFQISSTGLETYQEAVQTGSAIPAMTFSVVAIGGLFLASNIMGYGTREYMHDTSDMFFFARRLTLVITAIAGLCFYEKTDPIQVIINLGWKFPYRYSLYGLVYGVFLGYISPIQKLSGTMISVLEMGLLHVVADELFFRGMLTRIFLDKFESTLNALALSGIIFAAYQITYGSMWIHLNVYMKFYWIGVIFIFGGLPFAWLYSRARSILPGLICYSFAHLLILFISHTATVFD